MCAIVGVTGHYPDATRAAAALIRYRGPDGTRDWCDHRISLSHNRLSIIDLNDRASQPMWDAEGATGIVFNGEIYNYRELKKDLEKYFEFHTDSDTEVLLLGHKKYGASFSARVRGMFAYAIYDKRSGSISLFRDHAGIKPLYYYHRGDTLAFGSEMKAVLSMMSALQLPRTLDRSALASYLALGYVPAPATLYQEVRVLPRSHYLVLDLDTKLAEIKLQSSPISGCTTVDDLQILIEKKVLEHLVADVPVGLFFSGGTDSSLIASILKRHDRSLRAFSIRVLGRPTDEKYFTEIAEHLGLNATVHEFGLPEFESSYREVMDRIDTPIADSAIFPTYLVSQRASEHVKVVLSGEGGDELFFGYARQRILSRLGGSVRSPLTLLDRAFLASAGLPERRRAFAPAFSRIGSAASYYLFTMALAPELLKIKAWEAAKAAIAKNCPEPIFIDRDLYLENMLLRKADLATSYASIEGRVPLLDTDVMAAAMSFVADYRAQPEEKPVLKSILSRYLPAELVWRKKSGFGLALAPFVEASGCFNSDLDEAMDCLAKDIDEFVRLPSKRELVTEFPNFALGLLMLHRSLVNNNQV